MEHSLKIQISASEGAVLRTLGLIERRGFSLGKCAISEAGESGRSMKLTVSSSRPGDLLKRQLERLHDVQSVVLKPIAIVNKKKPGIRPINRRI
ncbi:MAG: acetolactate synthase [Gammaproteobacteria bacterium]|nr:acetolactate synthase [Gammaproteobacteria bacterium]